MTEKNDNPESNPDPALAEDTASASDQENVGAGSAAEESPPPKSLETELARPGPSPKKSFSFAPFLLVLILGAVGGGGFWVYEEQKKLHQEVQAGFNQMASRLDTVEADMQSLQRNQQQLEASNSAFQAHQSEVDETFQSQQNSLSTLDEDIVLLKDELNRLAEAQAAIPKTAGIPPPAKTETEKEEETESAETPVAEPGDSQTELEGEPKPVMLAKGQPAVEGQPAAEGEISNSVPPSTFAADDAKRPPLASPVTGQPTEAELTDPERSQEAQEYIDFVESTTGKFFRLVKEGFIKLWQWFASLFA